MTDLAVTPGNTDDHDEARSFTYRGVKVTITLRDEEYAEESGTDPDTVLVFIDTAGREEPFNLAIWVNDDDLWEGPVG